MMRKTIRTALSAVLFMCVSGIASAAASYQSGTIFDHTSITGGLLIRFNPALTPLPDNCAGASSNWMFIAESNKTMLAVALMAIAANNRWMDVYTSGIGSNGYCTVHQIDPVG